MNNIQAATDTSEYKKPYYTVQISYAGTGAEFRLNDIPFYLENFSGQVDVEIPVSDKMVQGVNELSIVVFTYIEGDDPVENWHEDARVEATLYVRENNSVLASRKILTHIKLYPAHNPKTAAIGSMLISEQKLPVLDYDNKVWVFPRVEYKKQIFVSRKTHFITTPFPMWEWQDGVTIEDTPENYRALLEAYRKEYLIHQNKDLMSLKDSTKKIAETQLLVNYYGNINKAYEILNLEESWDSKEQELFEFIEGERSEKYGLKLDIFGDGKLARITNDTGIQPILYIVKKARISIKYKYTFYKNKQGEWIYIM